MKKFLSFLLFSTIVFSSSTMANLIKDFFINGDNVILFSDEFIEGDISNRISTFGITADTYLTATSSISGRASTLYTHYGDFKYDGICIVRNEGSNPFTFEFYTASGRLVYKDKLNPGEEFIGSLLQNILKWDLCNGKGKVRVYTADGSQAEVYFRYMVLD